MASKLATNMLQNPTQYGNNNHSNTQQPTELKRVVLAAPEKNVVPHRDASNEGSLWGCIC
jgi:hypothetical protein